MSISDKNKEQNSTQSNPQQAVSQETGQVPRKSSKKDIDEPQKDVEGIKRSMEQKNQECHEDSGNRESKAETSENTKEQNPKKKPVDSAQTIEALTKALAEMKDKALRALAEVENVKQRSSREIQQSRLYANEKFAKDLLPIADNLDNALLLHDQSQEEKKSREQKSLVEGIQLTRKALKAMFNRHGIEEDNPMGKEFNPYYHQAISHIPDLAPSGQIINVMQKGYRIKERVLRASMVVISSGADTESSETKT